MAATAALRAVPRGAFGEGSGVEAGQGERRCMVISSCGPSVFGGTVLLRGARSAPGHSASDHPMRSDITRHVSPEGRSEEHTSEIQSLMRNSYAVFCLKKKKKERNTKDK